MANTQVGDWYFHHFFLCSQLCRDFMHSAFVNYLPELGGCDLFLMHIQRVLIACFVFCICSFMGTYSGTDTQGRPRGHIVLISTTKTSQSFSSPQPVGDALPVICGLVVSVNLLWSCRAVSFAFPESWNDAGWGCKYIAMLKLEKSQLEQNIIEKVHRMSVQSQSRKTCFDRIL